MPRGHCQRLRRGCAAGLRGRLMRWMAGWLGTGLAAGLSARLPARIRERLPSRRTAGRLQALYVCMYASRTKMRMRIHRTKVQSSDCSQDRLSRGRGGRDPLRLSGRRRERLHRRCPCGLRGRPPTRRNKGLSCRSGVRLPAGLPSRQCRRARGIRRGAYGRSAAGTTLQK